MQPTDPLQPSPSPANLLSPGTTIPNTLQSPPKGTAGVGDPRLARAGSAPASEHAPSSISTFSMPTRRFSPCTSSPCEMLAAGRL